MHGPKDHVQRHGLSGPRRQMSADDHQDGAVDA